MKTAVGQKVRAFAAAVAMGVAMSSFAGGLAEVQSALNQLYPNDGWIASNVMDVSKGDRRDCGLHNGVITTHPASQTVAATFTRSVSISGTYPVLHVRASSWKASGTTYDWVLRIRVNGLQVGSDATVASETAVDYYFPLAAWASQDAVKLELDNAPGGGNSWSNEYGFWHLIEIVENQSVYDNDSGRIVSSALDEKFPGWTARGVLSTVGAGYVGVLADGSVGTHPFDRGIPCVLSRTVELTGENPILVVRIASFPDGNGSPADWHFSAQVNGETVIPRQEIRTLTPVEFRYPLARWIGQETVEIRLLNWNGGSHNSWAREMAVWHKIAIEEGEATGLPALRYSYLQGQGKQFINTDYVAQQTSVFDVKLYEPGVGYTERYATVFCGGTYNDFGAVGFWNRSNSAFNGTFGLFRTGVTGGAFPVESWVDLNVDVPEKRAEWSGVGQAAPTTITASDNGINCVFPVFIFTANNKLDAVINNGTTKHEAAAGLETSRMRLHSFQVREGDVRKLDLVPYRRTDGLTGLLDDLTGDFYPNVGPGEFLMGGLAYALDGTRLIAHEGEMEPFDLKPDYTAIEKVGAGVVNVSRVTAALPPLTVTEGTVSFSGDGTRSYQVDGALALAARTSLVFGLDANGCDTVGAASVDLGEADAENPIRIRLVLGENIDYSQRFALIVAGLSGESLSCFALEDETPFALAIDDGALVLRYADPEVPVSAVWTNGAGDGDLANPANWATTNGLGQAISKIPTADTLVQLPDGCVFNFTNNAPLAYRELVLPAYIGGDCDWSGLPVPINTTVDLRGHNLRLSNLEGTGTITDSTGGEYQRLDYLQGDGTAYIDTGYVDKRDTRVDLDVAFHAIPDAEWTCFFGTRTSSKTDSQFCCFVHKPATGSMVFHSAVNKDLHDTSVVMNFDARYLVHLENNGPCTINGEEIDTGVFGANTLNDYLFSLNVNGVSSFAPARCRIYSCKIFTGQTLERDFVPVRRIADGVLGMLDQENGVFYPNSNTSGKFSAGDLDPQNQPGGAVILTVPEGDRLNGSGLRFTGCAKLLKDGPGTLFWDHGTMDASASVIVTNGVFRLGLATAAEATAAFGASGAFKACGKGQLDLNSAYNGIGNDSPLASRSIFIEGEGPDGQGALVNCPEVPSSPLVGTWVGRVVLSGDATIGGSERIDIAPGDRSEIVGRAFALTVKNWPYLVYGDDATIDVRSIRMVGHSDMALNNSITHVTLPEGLNLIGGCFSMHSTLGGSVTLPADLAVNVEPAGGTLSVTKGSATIYGPITVKGDGTFTFASGTASFAGAIRNDGTIVQGAGTLKYVASAAVTGSGTIEMTGGTALLAADVSGFTGTFRLVDGALSEGLGTFANCTVIDLSSRTDTLDVTGKKWNIAPSGSTVKIDLGSRPVRNGEKLLAWESAPAGVRFVSESGTGCGFIAKDSGLYAVKGLIVILR